VTKRDSRSHENLQESMEDEVFLEKKKERKKE